MDHSGNCVLAEGVVIEILSWLPVKSLLRLKCVCKFWYTLIKTPTFISSHLQHHHNNQTPNLLVRHYIPEIRKARLAMFRDDKVDEEVDYLEIPPVLRDMTGPVNGLFLLHSYEANRMALWNPATRQIRPLPLPAPNPPPNLSCVTRASGFGFDPLTQDYKVVWVPHIRDYELGLVGCPIVALYTLGNDSWRYLDDAPVLDSMSDITAITNPMCKPTAYLNGASYWLTWRNKIIAFDMSSDVFKKIEGPDNTGSNDVHEVQLVVHCNSVALLCPVGKLFIDMWVMEEEGCWTKHFSVGLFSDIKWPRGVTMNNEILLETSSRQLVLYNPNTRGIRYVGIQGNNYCSFLVSSYKESLISFKGGSRVGDHRGFYKSLHFQ